MKVSRLAKCAPPRILTITVRRISNIPAQRVEVLLAFWEALLQQANVTSVQRAEDVVVLDVDVQPRWQDRLFTGIRMGAVTATPLRNGARSEFSLRLQLHRTTFRGTGSHSRGILGGPIAVPFMQAHSVVGASRASSSCAFPAGARPGRGGSGSIG